MARPKAHRFPDRAELAVRLHDISATVAVGISMLKAAREGGVVPVAGRDPALEAFESALASLRGLAVSAEARKPRTGQLADELSADAGRLGLELEIEVLGEEGWLSDGEAELVRLAGYEALRNVLRHSGSTHCRLTLDMSDCPFALRVRDWGAGLSKANRSGDGINKLRLLALGLGAQLVVRSHPGIGTEFLLVGRGCPRTNGLLGAEARLRSVVAKESLGSRKRVADGRPIGPTGKQIS